MPTLPVRIVVILGLAAFLSLSLDAAARVRPTPAAPLAFPTSTLAFPTPSDDSVAVPLAFPTPPATPPAAPLAFPTPPVTPPAAPSAFPTSPADPVAAPQSAPLTVYLPLIARPEPYPPARRDIELEFIRLINLERAALGRRALREEPRLTQAARRLAYDLAARGTVSHIGSDGSTPASRARDAGYPWWSGEVALGAAVDAADAVKIYRTSPPHWNDLMNPDSTVIGVGVAPVLVGPSAGRRVAIPAMLGYDPPPPEGEVVAALLARINALRAERGAPPLTLNAALNAVARRVADDLTARNVCGTLPSHGPLTLDDWARDAGYGGSVTTRHNVTCPYDPVQLPCGLDASFGGASADEVARRIMEYGAAGAPCSGNFSHNRLADSTQTDVGIVFYRWGAVVVTGRSP
ncbi:CAP domain-containing protein [Roseiflexus castenholzii]|uniref:SCP-like extracellular n=1 Tax=Roseiflexus castenholzii (strain DSM 13941 / HLO8) TaxID=383372 RepID=A7NPK4_ROSCS|nr:CAP domain-containing protein [Roseiflexus castenholzii]ABU59500.1 SCP-like extracellular [Roseiflexus castenholzii DSM 13941]